MHLGFIKSGEEAYILVVCVCISDMYYAYIIVFNCMSACVVCTVLTL